MSYSVLLVEDDPLIGQGLELGLRARGFDLVWHKQGTGVVDLLQANSFDVLILDLGLPDIDGIDLLKILRKKAVTIPVIVLTARDSTKSLITGLDYGADDYVIKPVSTDVLAARIRAISRRIAGRASQTIRYRGLELDSLSHKVMLDDHVVELTPTEYILLEVLLTNQGKTLSIERMISTLEQSKQETTPQAIQVHIHSIRKKIGQSTIKTIRGVGYRMG